MIKTRKLKQKIKKYMSKKEHIIEEIRKIYDPDLPVNI